MKAIKKITKFIKSLGERKQKRKSIKEIMTRAEEKQKENLKEDNLFPY
ncbi:MAG: hypothetical protein ABIC82_05520 [bacterium]